MISIDINNCVNKIFVWLSKEKKEDFILQIFIYELVNWLLKSWAET